MKEKQKSLYQNLIKPNLLDKEKLEYIETGFKAIDSEIQGLIPRELILLSSCNYAWNNHFLINLAINVGKNHPVLYYSFKDSELILAEKFANTLLERPFFRPGQNWQDENLVEKSSELKIRTNCNKLNTCGDIYDDFVGDVYHNGVKLIIIEQFDLMFSNKKISLNAICKKLAKYAITEKVCIIISSQIPYKIIKNKKDKKPKLNFVPKMKLKPTVFDKVFFLHKDAYFGIMTDYDGNSTNYIMDFLIEKNRNGQCQHLRLKHSQYFHIENDGIF